MRYLRWFTGGRARAEYHALYHMNVATDARTQGLHRQGRRRDAEDLEHDPTTLKRHCGE